VLAELTQQSPQEVLDSFSAPLWKVLSDWLFEHRFNNIYHDLFYKLFRTVIRINHVESMKALFSKHKFITRMIEHYKTTSSKDSGLRSYIILMGNYVRLTADAQPPSEYLKSFLISHIQWKEFVPLLKDDTIKQFVTDFPAPSGGHPISLSPFASAETFGLYSSLAPPKPITSDEIDVDLGSEYANNLGLEDANVYVETKKKRKRKRKNKNKKASGEDKGENAEGEDEEEGDGDDSDGSDEEDEEEDDAPALEEETPALEEESPNDAAAAAAAESPSDAAEQTSPVEGDDKKDEAASTEVSA
jgi:hypothetical protein